jgi:hypothetical protein
MLGNVEVEKYSLLLKKLIKSPAEIICYACSFLRYCLVCKKKKDKELILKRGKNSAGNDAGSSQAGGATRETDD